MAFPDCTAEYEVHVMGVFGATLPKIHFQCETGGSFRCDGEAILALLTSAGGMNEEPE